MDPRVHTAAETRAIHEALCAVTNDELVARTDVYEMARAELYFGPELSAKERIPVVGRRIFDEEAAKSEFYYYLDYLDILREFVQEAASANLGLLIAIA